jgi:hypothetical protein
MNLYTTIEMENAKIKQYRSMANRNEKKEEKKTLKIQTTYKMKTIDPGEYHAPFLYFLHYNYYFLYFVAVVVVVALQLALLTKSISNQ